MGRCWRGRTSVKKRVEYEWSVFATWARRGKSEACKTPPATLERCSREGTGDVTRRGPDGRGDKAALSFPEFPMSNDFSDLDILMKLVVAALLSGVLGWEREVFGKQAGLRTHILVGVSAAMFVGLGGALMEYFGRDDEDMQYDPIRVIEATVAAISFLGAGTIFVSRDRGETVKGLTTAAALWATAGVGLAVGLGRFVLASGATALIFVVLHLLGRLERRGLPGAAKAARDEKSSEDGEP